MTSRPSAVAVYCASSLGKQKAFQSAAISLGHALASAQRPLVYGGGSKGIMGIVSNSVLEAGGRVTGVMPYAMVAAGGERDKTASSKDGTNGIDLRVEEDKRDKLETIIVNSMHERKVEMAKRVGGFVGLPGGFGTFEEVFEVITWTQLGIHDKPVVLLNILSYYNPLRELVRNGVKEGFILPKNEELIVFVDGPPDVAAHETFDWGNAALNALDGWKEDRTHGFRYDWTKTAGSGKELGQDKMDSA